MNASASQLGSVALVAIFSIVAPLAAQDVVTQKDGQRREGEILGMAGGKLKIKIGPAETSIQMDQVASVEKAPPKAYEDALRAWQEGNAEKTLGLLKPVVDTFRGLPADWAERASALLGDAYLSLDQLPAAEDAFAEFTKSYPGATSLSDLGLAQLAISKKDFAGATARLAPIIAEAEKVVVARARKGATYGQAFYLMGIVHENEGAYPEALRDYLSAVTLFHDDDAVVAKAQERADFLIKEKQVIVP
jgi:tetratricopeptide (TPR) repeat protein